MVDLATLGQHYVVQGRSVDYRARQLADVGVDETFYLGSMHPYVVQGAESKGINRQHLHVFEDRKSMIASLKQQMRKNDWILVKASRSMELDLVARAMVDEEN